MHHDVLAGEVQLDLHPIPGAMTVVRVRRGDDHAAMLDLGAVSIQPGEFPLDAGEHRRRRRGIAKNDLGRVLHERDAAPAVFASNFSAEARE